MDRLRKAYATLGLAPGASPREARIRYKALVKRWHPDRFNRDPQGQAEAARQMREINDAYHCIRNQDQPPPPNRIDPDPAAPTEGAATASPPRPGRRLSREEIEALVNMLQNPSPIDLVRGLLEWTWPLFLSIALLGPANRAFGASGGLLVLLLSGGLTLLLRHRRGQRRGRGQ